MYVSDDTARLCPKVAGLLNSDSHLKMFVIYRLAELKMNELGFDIPVGDKEAVNHLARFLKADVSVQAVISPKAAGTSPAPGKTKKNIKKRNKDKATPISKAKEKTGPYGNGDNKDTHTARQALHPHWDTYPQAMS